MPRTGTALKAARARNWPALLSVALGLSCAAAARAQNGDVSDEYRLTVSPQHPINGNLTGFGELGLRWNPDDNYDAFTVLYPGLAYTAAKWAQFSGGLRTLYTHDEFIDSKLELRPFAGVKLFLPNGFKWSLYNYTRYEYRDMENLDTHVWTSYSRLRSLFAAEIPLTCSEQAWEPRTLYLITSVEPFYRFGWGGINQSQAGGGIGYVAHDRIRIELTCQTVFTQPQSGAGLRYTENIINLNFKIGLGEGILRRVLNPDSAKL
ncbi:MAG TPA: DUF2490 domain-containing protein [Verrucomicrobiae bacterium]|jgi:hypothetical protein|nr:DUF2490 domain-containing protein [Verrucomicrobiae bacterium]